MISYKFLEEREVLEIRMRQIVSLKLKILSWYLTLGRTQKAPTWHRTVQVTHS